MAVKCRVSETAPRPWTQTCTVWMSLFIEEQPGERPVQVILFQVKMLVVEADSSDKHENDDGNSLVKTTR